MGAVLSRYIDYIEGSTEANPAMQSARTFAMAPTDVYIIRSKASGNADWTLPECIGLTGRSYTVSNQGNGQLALSGLPGEPVDGDATVAQGDIAVFTIQLISDSSAGCFWARQ
jgi:hypothetical protein